MDPFYGPGGRRAILPEIAGHIRERTGCTPVYGFAEMLDAGGARAGGERIASYMELHDRREWLLPLSAQRGMRWRTESVPSDPEARVAFVLNIGFGNGSPLPQPSGRWDLYVNERYALSVRVANHSILWRGQECDLAFAANRIECAEPYQGMRLSSLIDEESLAAFGPALLTVPTSWVAPGAPATLRIEPHAEAPSTRWVQLGPSANLLQTSDIYEVVGMLADGPHPRVSDHYVYFGDIHTHSGQVIDEVENKGCGLGTREENYAYARGAGGLDFYALTDHEWQIDTDNPAEYLDLADAHNEDGRFVCLPGYEYTNLLYGHRNVYFRDTGGAVLNTNTAGGGPTLDPSKCNTPHDLWTAMEASGVPFITVPHHTSATSHPFNPDFFHPDYDRLFEVYSCWGSSAYYGDFPRGVSDRLPTGDLRDVLQRGQRYGVIASADGHDGHPGNAQSPLIKHHHLFHFCGSGRAAVLCEELTRHAVFDALRARRCYATSGAPIVLDVRLDGADPAGAGGMGSEVEPLPRGQSPHLAVSCRGSNGIEQIRVVKDGRVVETVSCHGRHEYAFRWRDPAYDRGEPASYCVRVVQVDRESAWASPIWVG